MGFDAEYANLYDAFYAAKDYDAECGYLDHLIRTFGTGSRSILDIGSGTGNHSLRLAKLGYEVTGLEPSRGMREIALAKATNLSIDFHVVAQRAEEMDLPRRFGTIICMFNVIDYVAVGQELSVFLNSVRRHLEDAGLFIFDFRNAAPCLGSYEPVRRLWAEVNGRRVQRVSETSIDAARRQMRTVYTCRILDGHEIVREFRDEHNIRFFSPEDVEAAVRESGMTLLRMGEFLDLDKPASDTTWNVMAITQR